MSTLRGRGIVGDVHKLNDHKPSLIGFSPPSTKFLLALAGILKKKRLYVIFKYKCNVLLMKAETDRVLRILYTCHTETGFD